MIVLYAGFFVWLFFCLDILINDSDINCREHR